jgi:hypothetical protein
VQLLVACCRLLRKTGAGEESRTLDLNLGKVALYQLSYSRICFSARRRHQQQASIIEDLSGLSMVKTFSIEK